MGSHTFLIWQVGSELRRLLADGSIAFPSVFTFVGRAFASVDGIGKGLDPQARDAR